MPAQKPQEDTAKSATKTRKSSDTASGSTEVETNNAVQDDDFDDFAEDHDARVQGNQLLQLSALSDKSDLYSKKKEKTDVSRVALRQ